jgi:RNA polymerase sigma-54 factor
MALAQRLEIRQGQGLVMTPQLQQAIKLLQLSNLELQEFVAEELEKNPLLERERDEEAPPEREAAPDGTELGLDGTGPAETEFDADYQDVNPEARAGDVYEAPAEAGGAIDWSKAGSGGASLDDVDGFENRLTREKSLHEHLSDQLAMATADPATLMIGGMLIDATDESGYLRADLDEMAQRLGTDRATCVNA